MNFMDEYVIYINQIDDFMKTTTPKKKIDINLVLRYGH